ncbi:Glut1 [Trypoxylus dichotomus]
MRRVVGHHQLYQQHRQDQHPTTSESSVDTLATTTTTGSQHTVYAEVVEVEEYELGSDFESEAAAATIKLTSRGRHHAHSPAGTRRRSRDETKEEIQEDDEATLRELLIRGFMSNSHLSSQALQEEQVKLSVSWDMALAL